MKSPTGSAGLSEKSASGSADSKGETGDRQPSGDQAATEEGDRAAEEGNEREAMLPKSSEHGADDEEDTGKGLARTLTLTNGVTMIIGCIIGSGIFVSPTGVQEKAGSVGSSIIIWILCGVWCTIGAYCYAELGTMITKSGGDYAYLMEAFGPFVAFLRLWIESIVVRPCAITIMALTFALYLLRPIYPDCDPPAGSRELLAGSMIMVLCGVNCWSVKVTTTVQDWTTYGKVFALLIVIVTGLYRLIFGGPQYRDSFDQPFEGNFRDITSPAVAFYSGLFAYQGWAWLNFITEELINPKRNLPLAIMISMGLCTTIYALFNVALYAVISPDEMLISPAVAVLFAEKQFGRLAFVMPIFVVISTFGSVNGTIMTSSRLFFCGAREGQMPEILTMINKKLRTPIPSVIFTSFLSIMYLLVVGHIYVLINASQCTVWLAFAVVAMALIRLRYSMPDAPRPVKVNIAVPIVFTIGSLAFVSLSVIGAPRDTVFGLLIVLSAVPIYIVFIAYGKLPKFFRKLMYEFTVFWQKLFMLLVIQMASASGPVPSVGSGASRSGSAEKDQVSGEGEDKGGPGDRGDGKPLLSKDEQIKDEEDTGKGLARTLTLTNCVTMIVGCIIGSGIFVSPTGVQEGAGSVGASILIWITCGFWCALGAYCYAELGTLITKSGGDYAYLMEAFGPFIAFLRLWIEAIVVRPTALAIVGLTFSLYLLRPIYPDCDPPLWSEELLAVAMIVILCGVNCWSVKVTTIVQDWFTYAKVAALLCVVITGGYRLIFGGPQYRDSFDNLFEGNFRSVSQAAVGFYSGLFAYQGWTYLNFITEELINPTRNLPLAVFISMVIVTAVYVLYNIALYVVLSPEEMLISPAVAVVG
ncbi:hypothetical protein GCK32_001303 [Trichostrongylus colubriformis]|uniref:Uncharacterized protein n=1 Tax=Trichostrongylus colubriformis TaxID=6319 RepID=A0AAN8FRZ0_TRICO